MKTTQAFFKALINHELEKKKKFAAEFQMAQSQAVFLLSISQYFFLVCPKAMAKVEFRQ